MPVTISFGSTRLPLNEIAKLTTGSIVELNRSIAEPVEIMVNNRSIARGEVVVLEGNFAVRIKQVMSRNDRLRSLT
jgi:flagellar motor switch protein FliN/FliY